MTRHYLPHLVLGILMFSQEAFSQQFLFFNSVKLDTNRYQDVTGSPYLYDTWPEAIITKRDGSVYEKVKFNFNGYEQKFEINQADDYRVLDDKLYEKIEISLLEEDENFKESFVLGVHFEIALKLSNIIYKGEKVSLIRDFQVRIAESNNEIYGDPTVHKKFVQSRYYSILYKSKLYSIILNKKRLGKVFNNKELINELIKKNGLELSKETDLIKLMVLVEPQID